MVKSRPRWFLPEHLKHQGKTQEWLAGEIGLSPGHLSDIIRGKHRFTEETLGLIAKALKLTPAEVLARNPFESTGPDKIARLWDHIDSDDRETLEDMAQRFARRPRRAEEK